VPRTRAGGGLAHNRRVIHRQTQMLEHAKSAHHILSENALRAAATLSLQGEIRIQELGSMDHDHTLGRQVTAVSGCARW
jgi:hypothetical protein